MPTPIVSDALSATGRSEIKGDSKAIYVFVEMGSDGDGGFDICVRPMGGNGRWYIDSSYTEADGVGTTLCVSKIVENPTGKDIEVSINVTDYTAGTWDVELS